MKFFIKILLCSLFFSLPLISSDQQHKQNNNRYLQKIIITSCVVTICYLCSTRPSNYPFHTTNTHLQSNHPDYNEWMINWMNNKVRNKDQ